MAAFSYQQQFQPFMLDPLVSPHTPYDSSFTTLNSMFSPSDQVIIHQSCSNNPDDVPNVMNCPDQDSRNGYNGVTFENMTYVTGKQSITESSSAVVDDKFEEAEPASQRLIPMTRKRKSRNGSCSSSAQSKDTRKVRSRKQKNCNKEEIKDKKREEKNSEKGTEEQPKDYVHVRARRGQATDSHSLAERVRRERISERMKILQQLVPGCDKVTGKALMLDEIINYVQSLHNQVEFLSMRLASLSSLIYECGVDLDGFMVRPEGLARFEPAEMPPVQQMGPLMATSAFTDVMANNPYPSTLLHDPSLLLLPQSNNPLQVPAQIHGNEMREVEGEKRQKYVHPTGFTNNLCSFH